MGKILRLIVVTVLSGAYIGVFAQDRLVLKVDADEYWWAGLSSKGHEMPYDVSSVVSYDMFGDNHGNQAQPLLLSSTGRYVWSEEPIAYSFDKGTLVVTSRTGRIIHGESGNTLRESYEYVSRNFFPSDGKIPDALLFTVPQYNTWIELMYNQNQEDILQYAEDILRNGYPAGVLMIDDNWQEDYGKWRFSKDRFTDPKGMIERLHEMGFKVMVWVCPYVSPDSETYRYLAEEGMLLLDPEKTQNILWANTKNKAAIIRWWNGASACLDLSNPRAKAWLSEQLDFLVEEYGVDGFKFDAGDADAYVDPISFRIETPNDQTRLYAELGLKYPLNEYRASWKMAGRPLVQRLRDKTHAWEDLQRLIPDLLSQSMMGYAYTCPDMIGGGEYLSFLSSETIDQELVVRSAQVHALMPMMQFSVAPWRVLSESNQKICLDMARLHREMSPTILQLARRSSRTGIPIVAPLSFVFPGQNLERVKDQFMLGDRIMVAPVIEKGQYKRSVVFPEGTWRSERGEIIQGGRTLEVEVPLARLPYFTKID